MKGYGLLKPVFHKMYIVHSWILCLIWHISMMLLVVPNQTEKKSHIKTSNTKRKRLNTKFYGCHDIKKNEIFLQLYISRGKFRYQILADLTLLAKIYIYIYWICVFNLHLWLWNRHEPIIYNKTQRQYQWTHQFYDASTLSIKKTLVAVLI